MNSLLSKYLTINKLAAILVYKISTKGLWHWPMFRFCSFSVEISLKKIHVFISRKHFILTQTSQRVSLKIIQTKYIIHTSRNAPGSHWLYIFQCCYRPGWSHLVCIKTWLTSKYFQSKLLRTRSWLQTKHTWTATHIQKLTQTQQLRFLNMNRGSVKCFFSHDHFKTGEIITLFSLTTTII